jgi:hypothetical protein
MMALSKFSTRYLTLIFIGFLGMLLITSCKNDSSEPATAKNEESVEVNSVEMKEARDLKRKQKKASQAKDPNRLMTDSELGLKFLAVEEEFGLSRGITQRVKNADIDFLAKRRDLQKAGKWDDEKFRVTRKNLEQDRRSKIKPLIGEARYEAYIKFFDEWKPPIQYNQ